MKRNISEEILQESDKTPIEIAGAEEIKKWQKPVKKVREYWKVLGPGFITGAADDDASGIATYSQTGAQTGFSLIWLSLFSLPLMATVQEMCARIGLTTGVGLAANIKRHFSKKLLYTATFLLLFANVFNIGADLGAMAKGVQLVFPETNFSVSILFFAFFSLALQIFIPYRKYSKYLKYLSFVLLAYVFSAFFVNINWGDVFKHLVIPEFSFSKNEVILVCAVLGTTISPYLFFWQTSEEVEEKILEGEKTEKARREKNTLEDIKKMRTDVWSGMTLSNIIMFFIIATCAATLFGSGITNIETATDAALALRPFAGEAAFVVFAIGIIGTGLLAIPVLAGSASYAISEALHWKTGLYRKFKQATSFYGVIIVAMALGIILNFIGLHPIKVLIYSAILNGIISPIVLFFIVRISSDEKIMGNFKNKKLTNIVGWFTVLLLSVVSIATIIFLF